MHSFGPLPLRDARFKATDGSNQIVKSDDDDEFIARLRSRSGQREGLNQHLALLKEGLFVAVQLSPELKVILEDGVGGSHYLPKLACRMRNDPAWTQKELLDSWLHQNNLAWGRLQTISALHIAIVAGWGAAIENHPDRAFWQDFWDDSHASY